MANGVCQPEITPSKGQARVWAEMRTNYERASAAGGLRRQMKIEMSAECLEMTTKVARFMSQVRCGRHHCIVEANRSQEAWVVTGSGFAALSVRRRNLRFMNWLDGENRIQDIRTRGRRRFPPQRLTPASSAIHSSTISTRDWVDHCRVPWSGQHPARESREQQRRESCKTWMNCWRFAAACRSRPAAHVHRTEGSWLFSADVFIPVCIGWHCWHLGVCCITFDRFSR